jgi:site-specific recombinase XerD
MTMLAVQPEPVDHRWAPITAQAPTLAATCRHYLDQIAVSVRPATVVAADKALRLFAGWLIDNDPAIRSLAGINRRHIEAYKLWLADRENVRGEKLKKSTINLRLGMLRVIFERLIEWDHPDAPLRNPIFGTDLPKLDEPLPRFLDDQAAAAFMHAATRLDPFRRLVVEMLARTGMRVGELCALPADAVVTVGETQWLRVPVGKLHTDRYIPLHPILLELLQHWRAWAGPDDTALLITNQGRPLTRHAVARVVARCARLAGIGHVNPHRLRHTLATQAINRGMSLEAIAALLGHRSMRMTLVYARIADRTVADQYYAATEQVEALYTDPLTTSPA